MACSLGPVTVRLSHRSARVLGAIGRTLIGFGVITLLFVAYQLWGTGLQQSRAQTQLGNEFAAQLEALGTDPLPTTTTTEPRVARGLGTSGPVNFPGATTTTTEPEPIDAEVLAAVAPTLGEPVAQMQIPSIGVDETVVYGIRVPDLRKGPGVFPGNPMPGTPGNAAIAGHRTTYGQPFHDLDLIEPGDEIVITTLRGEFTYEVMAHTTDDGERGHFIVPANGVHVLDDYGDNRITLVACHPKYSARQRIIVTGQLVEDPVEPPPDSEPRPDEDGDDDDGAGLPAEPTTEPEPPAEEGWGDGLDGDNTALIPTAVWGGLFGLGLFGAWLGGHLWRRWPAYVIASPLVVWLLWSWFVHLDQLLPSY